MQIKALENLNRLRNFGENKALVIASTGTGKTYMAAFDVLAFDPKRVLYIVHREDILRNAQKTFASLCKNKNIKTGFYTGNKKDKDVDYLFATNLTMDKKFGTVQR
jgi:superfamily II DNA or RNA helicase